MRPKSDNPKAIRFTVRLTPAEKAALFDHARQEGKTPSAIMRALLFEAFRYR